MEWLDAFSAENREMIGAVKMLDTLRMFFTQFFTQSVFVFIIEIERRRIQDRIFLNNFVEDVNVQW